MKINKKLTWIDLERHGLSEHYYGEYINAIQNIEDIFIETIKILEESILSKNPKQEFKNLIQLSAILDNEMQKANGIIDLVLVKADEIEKNI